jgi:hypothetical protein
VSQDAAGHSLGAPRDGDLGLDAELATDADAVNLAFARNVIGASGVAKAAVVCRAANSFPLSDEYRAQSVEDLG